MADAETIGRLYAWASKNRDKYFEEYQLTGSAAKMRTYEKYEDILDVCILAGKQRSEEDELRRHILRNQLANIDELLSLKTVNPKKTFTYEEVEKWMRRMMV